jgi:hypothetical protein
MPSARQWNCRGAGIYELPGIRRSRVTLDGRDCQVAVDAVSSHWIERVLNGRSSIR